MLAILWSRFGYTMMFHPEKMGGTGQSKAPPVAITEPLAGSEGAPQTTL